MPGIAYTIPKTLQPSSSALILAFATYPNVEFPFSGINSTTVTLSV